MKNYRHLCVTRLIVGLFTLLTVQASWAADFTVTYNIGYTVSSSIRHAYITRADNSELTTTWHHGINVLWPKNEVHGVDDEYDITFKPNYELDSEKVNGVQAFYTETAEKSSQQGTTFTVAVGASDYYIKSVTFMNGNKQVASAAVNTVTSSYKKYNVLVAPHTFFNAITVVLTDNCFRVTPGSGLSVTSSPSQTYNNTDYYLAGSTVTLAPTDDNYIVTGVSGVDGATIATDKHGFSFTMPSQDVTPTATLVAIAGTCGDNATWTMSDANSDGTYETLTISGTGATYDYNASNNRAPWKTDFSPTALVLTSGITQIAIADEADLRLLSAYVNSGNTAAGKSFRQTADITLNGDFDPIGVGSSNNTIFNGSYDGGGFTISGLSINTDNYYVGLFGYVKNCTVNNVHLISPTLTSSRNGEAMVGAIIGMTGNVHVENCWVYKPTLSTTGSGTKNVGAIIGKNFNYDDSFTNLYYYDDTHNYATVGGYIKERIATRVARARKVTVNGSGISMSTDASDPVNGFTYGGNKYYREGLELTVGVTDQNTAISSLSTGDGGPACTLASDKKSATVTVPAADFSITASLITTSGKTGYVYWVLTDEDGDGTYETMTISGTGEMTNYSKASDTPWFTLRSGIKSLIVGNGVRSIGSYAFTASGLTSIELPATITVIENYAFASCANLTSIEIPASVTIIGESAFNDCKKLASVTIYAPSLSTSGSIGNYMFDNNASGRKIYVFSDCVDTYKNTWNAYKNAFEPITLTANEGAKGEYWTTYYNDLSNAQAPKGTQVFKASLDGANLTLTPIADGIITRGEAVVLKSSSASIEPLYSATASADDYADNDLLGTMKRITNPGNAYVLNKKGDADVGFYRLKSTGTIGAHKAYLTYSSSEAREFFGFTEEDVTSIDNSQLTIDNEATAPVYNLAGQRIEKPRKGLYIKNGRKVLVK